MDYSWRVVLEMKKIILSCAVLIALTMSTLLILPGSTQAATKAACAKKSDGFLGFPTWYKYLEPKFEGGNCEIKLPTKTNGDTDIAKSATRILLAVFEIALRIGGMVAVVFVIYGGFQFILSQGEPEKHKGARSTIINALIGLAITISATAIVNLIGRNI